MVAAAATPSVARLCRIKGLVWAKWKRKVSERVSASETIVMNCYQISHCVVDVTVGSLILGRTMRDSRDDDEAEAVMGAGAGAAAVVAPSSGGGLHSSSFLFGSGAFSFSGDAASAVGVSSPATSISAPAVPKRKFSLVLCFWTCLMCATRMASELPTGVPRCNRSGTVEEVYTLVTWVLSSNPSLWSS